VLVHDVHDHERPHDHEALVGLLRLARACELRGLAVAAFSSGVVFDGSASRPYVESDPALPATAFGSAQRRFEGWVQAVAPSALLVRTGLLLDPDDAGDPLARVLAALASGACVRMPDDEIAAPSLVAHLLDAVLDLLIDGERGLWHATHAGACSLYELVRTAAGHAGIATEGLVPGRSAQAWGLELGAGMRAIASERAWPMPAAALALAAYAGSVAQSLCDATSAA
jgi:dTDP-4-dehydrorhamnose reductase